MKSTWGAALVQILVVANLVIMGAYGAPQVPCYFIFGDSMADNGNSNSAQTDYKANYEPYGIDFPSGPTGRFSDGKTIIDVISEKLGFDEYIKPFATANDSDILSGVNYAFSSAGILNETGLSRGEVVSFSKQLSNHKKTVLRLSKKLGSQETPKYLNKCLYSIGIGTNDYLLNYFQPEHHSSSKNYTVEQFADLLSDRFREQIKILYGEGARKFVVFQPRKIGLVPLNYNESESDDGKAKLRKMDEAVDFFIGKLEWLTPELNKKYSDAKFTNIRTKTIEQEANGFDFGYEVACCPMSSNGLCVLDGVPYEIRRLFLYWDGYHTTEAYNTFYGETSYRDNVGCYYVNPYDIQTLIAPPEEVAAAE